MVTKRVKSIFFGLNYTGAENLLIKICMIQDGIQVSQTLSNTTFLITLFKPIA